MTTSLTEAAYNSLFGQRYTHYVCEHTLYVEDDDDEGSDDEACEAPATHMIIEFDELADKGNGIMEQLFACNDHVDATLDNICTANEVRVYPIDGQGHIQRSQYRLVL